MEFYTIISDTFWSEKFWFPANYSWSDFETDDTATYPKGHHLLYSFPIAISLLVLRYIFETYVFKPIGRHYGLQEKFTIPATRNRHLEKIYRKRKRPEFTIMKEASEQCGISQRSVEVWFRRRRNMDKYSMLKKFSESGWRFLFYLLVFIGGIWTLWSKPHFWETKQCWIGYPKQSIETDIFWYYMIELGFYWSLLFSIFYDVRRKDFAEMVVHHIATISLIVFSWMCNFVRVGTLVLAVHDAVDYWIELAKMMKYIQKNWICDILFAIFTIVWLCTRMTILPLRILRTTLFEGLHVSGVKPFPAYYFFNTLLCLLQLLNFIWGFMILYMLFQVYRGELQKDARSDSEMSDDDEENDVRKDNGLTPHLNGIARSEGENGTEVRHRSNNN